MRAAVPIGPVQVCLSTKLAGAGGLGGPGKPDIASEHGGDRPFDMGRDCRSAGMQVRPRLGSAHRAARVPWYRRIRPSGFLRCWSRASSPTLDRPVGHLTITCMNLSSHILADVITLAPVAQEFATATRLSARMIE